MDTDTELHNLGDLVWSADLKRLFGEPTPRIVVGVDPGLNGDASDEAHCAFLLGRKGPEIGILAGQLVPSGITDNSLTPLVQMMRLATLIQQSRKFVRAQGYTEDAQVLVVVERNMVATAGPVYRQVLHLLRKGAWGGKALGDAKDIIFVPDLTEPSSEELGRGRTGPAAQDGEKVEDTDKGQDSAPKRKKVRKDPLQDRVGVYTTQWSKIRNSNAYLAQFDKNNTELSQKKLVIINSSRSEFQLPGLKLMETVEAQRKLFKLGEKQKIDGVVQHNDMYMVFTFTLAWVTNFQKKYVYAQQEEFVRVAKYKETRAARLIESHLAAEANAEEDEAGGEAPILQPVAGPAAQQPDDKDVLDLDALTQEQRDAYVAITAVRFSVAYYLKRACSLLRRLILQRVLLEGWQESANCGVSWCRQAPRTSWKQILMASNIADEQTAKATYGRPHVSIHWQKSSPGKGLWWPTPLPAGSVGDNELRSLGACVDSACQQARDVIARHHRHHPQYGATGRDLGVFCRLLQTCAQQLHGLSLAYDVECTGRPQTIPTESSIRTTLAQNPQSPRAAGIMDPDYAESYFSLLAYTNALTSTTPRSRAVLQKFADRRPGYPVRYTVEDLELQIRRSTRVPYAAVCRTQLDPTNLANMLKAHTAGKAESIRCTIVAR